MPEFFFGAVIYSGPPFCFSALCHLPRVPLILIVIGLCSQKTTTATTTTTRAKIVAIMTRTVDLYAPYSSYTIVPITSPWPPDVAATEHESPGAATKVLLAILVAVMIIMTTVGNALVCLAVLLVRKLKNPQNYLLVSLAVADFCIGLVVMPLALNDLLFDRWPLGRFMCSFYTTADLTLCTASIVNLCAISVDRYLVISRPLRYSAQRTSKRILTYILIVWVIAAIVGFSSHIIADLLDDGSQDPGTCQVIPHFIYQIYATIIAFYGPTLIMIILNIKIWRAAKRLAAQDRIMSHCNSIDASDNYHHHPKSRGSHEHTDLLTDKEMNGLAKKERTNSTSSRLFKIERKYLHRPSSFFTAVKGPLIRHNEKSECKARKTLGVIMSVFIICWLPFFSLAILKSCLGVNIPAWLDLLALWLGYSNSTLNPLIYCKYNKEFRIPFREILACRCSTLQSVMRQQSFTSRYGPPVRRRYYTQTIKQTSSAFITAKRQSK